MAKIGFRVSVDDNGVPEDIRSSIERGIRKATKRLAKKIQERAEAEIQEKNAADNYGIWEGDLITGFHFKHDGDSLRVWNDDEAAGPMEHGVAPGSFGARGPPIANLLPWVREHFNEDTDFDPWGIGGGDNFIPGTKWKDNPNRVTSDPDERFSTPDGDRTQTGADDLSER